MCVARVYTFNSVFCMVLLLVVVDGLLLFGMQPPRHLLQPPAPCFLCCQGSLQSHSMLILLFGRKATLRLLVSFKKDQKGVIPMSENHNSYFLSWELSSVFKST